MIAYVSIGNSDDKLIQRRWVCLQLDVKTAIHERDVNWIGEWHSYPDSIFQNACYCFEIDDAEVPELKGELAGIAKIYQQDAIAWAEAPVTEFLGSAS